MTAIERRSHKAICAILAALLRIRYPLSPEGDDGRVVLVGQCEQQLVRCHAGGERIALSKRNAEPLKAVDIFSPIETAAMPAACDRST